ncbi:MAG: hypothetical protein A2Z62_00040 [Candidatus Terrybacteria bacterium RIFCSPLOWO2_02_42_20]|uniref:Uncharacterized protein n=2 Tax=Candidatus Terryibacteriota TaxID=1817920 RepID=A0A1G2PQB0_9BACT|nr:MAG: hypothetical protein A2W59_00530 [Candidatus Terrybacteria bacterium RIFCSPHIGHO2_02_41_19]OHA54119.1 MAG: hypothetical protein A2Z62_00040 [Candidatus Terrybacteria bacterium RIFCSPLOWO2_02_42_20]
MNTAVEFKKISKNKDIIRVSRQEYEALLEKQRFIPVVNLTFSEKKALEKARREMAKGDYLTLDELKNELGTANLKKR